MSRTNYRLTKLRDGSSRINTSAGSSAAAVPDGPFRSTEYGSGLLKDIDQEPIQFRVFSKKGSLVSYFPWFCAETINFSLSSKIQQFITQDGEKLVNNGPAVSTLDINGYVPLVRVDKTPISLQLDTTTTTRESGYGTTNRDVVTTSVQPNLPDEFVAFYDLARLSSLAYTDSYAEVVVDGIRCTGGFISRSSEERADRPNVVVFALSFVCTDISTPYRHNPLSKTSDKVNPPTEAEKSAKASK